MHASENRKGLALLATGAKRLRSTRELNTNHGRLKLKITQEGEINDGSTATIDRDREADYCL